MKRALAFLGVTCFCTTIGCGTKKGTAASAKLALANGTSSSALTTAECPDMGGGFVPDNCYTPTSYGLKILNVYVSPDAEGARSGPAGLIWADKDCPLQSDTSDIDGKQYSYDKIGDGCSDDKVTSFFDLARTSDQVNADLNSQDHAILPGTYNYVAMTFCIGGPQSKNARFKTEDMSEWFEVQSGTCGITSVKADPAIVVGEGESVTVTLNYDLTNIIYQNGNPTASESNSSCYLDSAKTMARCFGYPRNLKPSFVRR